MIVYRRIKAINPQTNQDVAENWNREVWASIEAAQKTGAQVMAEDQFQQAFPPQPEPRPQLTDEEKQQLIVDCEQAYLDEFARTRNYDSIFTACTYATSTNPKFAQEGRYAVQARDEVWAKCYQILGEYLAGQRPEPTLQDVLAELPALAWPEG